MTLTEAAVRMGMPYGKARDWLMTRRLVEMVDGKVTIADEEAFEAAAEKGGLVLVKGASIVLGPREVPKIKPGDTFVSKRQLILNGPFFGGMVTEERQVDQVVVHGKWRVKFTNGTTRYILGDWLNPDSWATALEANIKTLMDVLGAGLKKVKGKDTEAVNRLIMIAMEWHVCLQEWRLGLQRGLGRYSSSDFAARMDKADKTFYRQEWKQKMLLPLYPKGFEIIYAKEK